LIQVEVMSVSFQPCYIHITFSKCITFTPLGHHSWNFSHNFFYAGFFQCVIVFVLVLNKSSSLIIFVVC